MGSCRKKIRKYYYSSLFVYGRVGIIITLCNDYFNLFYRLGEVCSHVAALLFKVEACNRLGIATLTCTSLPCVWNQAFSKKVCTCCSLL